MSGTGVGGLIRTGAQLELDLNLETLSIGAETDVLTMETAGAHLCYRISIHSEEIRIGVSLMDDTAAPQTLLRVPDSEPGWQLLARFIGSLERNEVKSLTRPIISGTPGQPDAWVIS